MRIVSLESVERSR